MSKFTLTSDQSAAMDVLRSQAKYIMLYGGSRSGKTFLLMRSIIARAIKAPGSRHAVIRHRANAVYSSIVLDTYPKVLRLCWPDLAAKVIPKIKQKPNYSPLPNGSEIWFCGLDDGAQAERILGMEFATIYNNECSQIKYSPMSQALTRLAQQATQVDAVGGGQLRSRAYFDCNPPGKSHWSYKMFVQGVEPSTKQPIRHREQYASYTLNPAGNTANLSADYIQTLEALPPRLRRRFLLGEWLDESEDQLFTLDVFDRNRVLDMADLPDMQRIVVAVDPSGSAEEDNRTNDAIGIVVAGLGVDGNAYVLEDATIKGGPEKWGKVAVSAYDRHNADLIVGEGNYGGDMVRFVIQSVRSDVRYKSVTATRGKVVRAEPVSALYHQDKVKHVGNFNDLEDELMGFTPYGFTGGSSPNRADGLVWGVTELFPGVVQNKVQIAPPPPPEVYRSWAG